MPYLPALNIIFLSFFCIVRFKPLVFWGKILIIEKKITAVAFIEIDFILLYKKNLNMHVLFEFKNNSL